MTAILLSLQKVRERYCPRACDSSVMGGMAAGKAHFKAACCKRLGKQARNRSWHRVRGAAQQFEKVRLRRRSASFARIGGTASPVMHMC